MACNSAPEAKERLPCRSALILRQIDDVSMCGTLTGARSRTHGSICAFVCHSPAPGSAESVSLHREITVPAHSSAHQSETDAHCHGAQPRGALHGPAAKDVVRLEMRVPDAPRAHVAPHPDYFWAPEPGMTAKDGPLEWACEPGTRELAVSQSPSPDAVLQLWTPGPEDDRDRFPAPLHVSDTDHPALKCFPPASRPFWIRHRSFERRWRVVFRVRAHAPDESRYVLPPVHRCRGDKPESSPGHRHGESVVENDRKRSRSRPFQAGGLSGAQ